MYYPAEPKQFRVTKFSYSTSSQSKSMVVTTRNPVDVKIMRRDIWHHWTTPSRQYCSSFPLSRAFMQINAVRRSSGYSCAVKPSKSLTILTPSRRWLLLLGVAGAGADAVWKSAGTKNATEHLDLSWRKKMCLLQPKTEGIGWLDVLNGLFIWSCMWS